MTRGRGAPRQTRVALSAKEGQNRSQLVCTGGGGGVGAVLPNVSCLPLTYIYLYAESSRCACACTYGMCVYIDLYAVYIKIYTYMDLF